MNNKTRLTGLTVAALTLVGCANLPSVAELNQITDQIVKASFRTQAHVNVERLTQTDDTNRFVFYFKTSVFSSFPNTLPYFRVRYF